MKTSFQCANFKPGYIFCELCKINKRYIDLQNAELVSCFKSDKFDIKSV